MSSAWTRSDTSSPSARSLRDDVRHRRNGRNSPHRRKSDALASSVWDEFSRLYVDEDRSFRQQLDDQVAEQERLHKEALALAAAEHERVRESAERARERVELEIDRERRRREEEEVKALEAERKAAAERDAAERARLKEELQRQEEEQKRRVAEQKDIADRQSRLAEQKRTADAEEERRKREQKEAESRAREESATAAAPTTTTDKPPAATTSVPSEIPPSAPTPSTTSQFAPTVTNGISHAHPAPSVPASNSQRAAQPQSSVSVPSISPLAPASVEAREAQHRRYLDLHKRLKKMREYVLTEGKKKPELKMKLGEWRRTAQRLVGQFTVKKQDNREPLKNILELLRMAQQYPEPGVDVSSFLISRPTDGSPILMSGPLVYLLNILSKSIISQFVNGRADMAEPIGVMAVTIFATKNFLANGNVSLIDILMAKYHTCCPVLWGVYGSEKTEQGRSRIGWWKQDGEWVSEQRHNERMSGLGLGYAAISLRDFSKSQNQNPYPPSNYWKTMSYIVNTSPGQVQPTHFHVLKALLDGYVPKFVGFYGQAALAVLRKALVDFPAQAPSEPARDAVLTLREQIQKEFRIAL